MLWLLIDLLVTLMSVKGAVIASLLITAGVIVTIAPKYQALYEVTDSYQYAAMKAGEAVQMRELLLTLKKNLDIRGLSSGERAWFFKGPNSDLRVYNESILGLLHRLNFIVETPANLPAYQLAMADIRQTLAITVPPAFDIVRVQYWSIFALLLVWVLPFVLFIVWFFTE